MTNFLDSNIIKKFIPILIFLFAFSLRIYDINWDQNQHLHPDERFLTMTTVSMGWPKSFSEYLNPSLSKLNPYNVGSGFFVYGTFPTTIVKYLSRFELFGENQYNNITLTGRLISVIFDVGAVVLIFITASKIFDRKTGLLAAFLYTISVLPIQLSHFFAVDTFLNFFLVLSFYFLIKTVSEKKSRFSIFLGLSYGAALACKISAVYFLPVIILGYLFILIKLIKEKKLLLFLYLSAVFAIFTYVSFRMLDPHVFEESIIFPKPNPQFIQNITDLRSQGTRESMFPPAIQWLSITPILFPFKNLVLWGLGLPLGLTSTFAVFYYLLVFIKSILKKKNVKIISNSLKYISAKQFNFFILIFWILFLFFYQSIQFTPSMRYFLPIYPFLAIICAGFITNIVITELKHPHIVIVALLVIFFIWPLSFLSIYSRPHSRVSASEWIYKNIPKGSTISCDLWDDCLPLSLDKMGTASQYKILTMEPFAMDTPEKQIRFNLQLQQLDYLILSSNRAWGSLTKAPDKFPFMSKFYEDLFAGKLNFTKVVEITSYPTIPILNISIPDQLSEEAFTIYDHPEILIYKKI